MRASPALTPSTSSRLEFNEKPTVLSKEKDFTLVFKKNKHFSWRERVV